jgi:GT2 family glycosyltransferase
VSDVAECQISVVIPVFNPGALLRVQLDALGRQEDPGAGWEVILADNGCTDGSLQWLRDQDGPAPVSYRVVEASGRPGPAHARNRGATEASGRWLVFCDADDVVSSDWLARLWDARDAGEVIAGACDVTRLNKPALLKARGGPSYGRTLPMGPCQFLPYAPSCNVMVRRATFERLGGWDEALPYCEDVDFSWRAQLMGARLAFASEAIVHYRYRDSLRGVFTQMRRYKAAEATLYVRYRDAGARRSGAVEVMGRMWWLLSRSPYAVLGLERRSLWWSILGALVGRLQGSVRNRVVYL